MSSPAVSNHQRLESAPVIQGFQVLNTNISGVDRLVPVAASYSFSQAIQILVGRNGVGKSGLMHMLYSSIRNNNYFEENGCASLREDFTRYPELLGKLSKRQLSSRDRNLVANFALENSSNFVFLAHLNKIDSAVATRISTGQSYLLNPSTLQKLFDNLVQDTPFNRFFYLQLRVEHSAVFPIYQATVSPKDSTKKIKDPIELGAFNPHFDGLDLRGSESVSHLKFANGVQLEKFSFSKATGEINFREKALSSGESAFFDWQITRAKVEQFFTHQEISFPCAKTFADRGFILTEPGQEVVTYVPTGSKLVLILDEPTSFLDWESADEFTAQLIQMLQKYPGRIQVVLATHDRTLLKDLASHAEYFNFMHLPGVVQDESPRNK